MTDGGDAVPGGSGARDDAAPAMVTLTAVLVERGMVRYSPTGVPVLECRLAHRSVQREADLDRVVAFEIAAVALGDLCGALDAIPLDAEVAVAGFLAPVRHGARQLVLHLTRIAVAPAAEPS